MSWKLPVGCSGNRSSDSISRVWLLRVLALVAACVCLGRAASTIDRFNNCIDEPVNIAAAVTLYEEGRLGACVEHPPLARIVAAVPLFLSGVHMPASASRTTLAGLDQTSDEANQELFHSAVPYAQLLRRVRLCMLIFPAVAMLYLYLLGRWLKAEIAGLIAVIFLSTDPNFLGHAFWVCTDMAACAGYLAATYHGLRWVVHRGMAKAIAAGAALALAFSTKFTCILAIPAIAAFLILRPLANARLSGRWRWERMFRRVPKLSEFAVVAVTALLVLWAVYFFEFGSMQNQTVFTPGSVGWKGWEALPARLKSMALPMPSLVLGMFYQMAHVNAGHPSYLNGMIRTRGWWYYFPEALLVKSPLALLIGILLALVLLIRRPRPPMIASLVLIIPPAVFMISAMRSPIDIGIRLVLPVIPFLYLIVCAQLVRHRLTPILFLLIAMSFIETGFAHPDYASFFNLATGGEARGSRYLTDSNLDWGQYVAGLSDWLHQPAQRGKPYSTRLFILPPEMLLQHYGLDPASATRRPVGLFCISECVSKGPWPAALFDYPLHDYSWLKNYPIVKRIGGITVYNLGNHPRDNDGPELQQ